MLDVENYRVLAEQNRIRKEPILAPRGKLFDRENRLVVDNYPSVTCFLVREQNQNVDADLPLIAQGPGSRPGSVARDPAPLPRRSPATSPSPSSRT